MNLQNLMHCLNLVLRAKSQSTECSPALSRGSCGNVKERYKKITRKDPLAYAFRANFVLEMCVYLLFLFGFWSTSEGSDLNKCYLTEQKMGV